MDTFKLRFDPSLLPHYAARYDYGGDARIEAEIAPSVKERGYFYKNEFVELCTWKSPRIKSRAKTNSAELIKEVTTIALANALEEMRLKVLLILRGVGVPTASVVLHFTHNDPYPILDFRALWSLSIDPAPTDYEFDFWLGYMGYCRMLSELHSLPMRTVDRALWQYSKENQPVGKEKGAIECL